MIGCWTHTTRKRTQLFPVLFDFTYTPGEPLLLNRTSWAVMWSFQNNSNGSDSTSPSSRKQHSGGFLPFSPPCFHKITSEGSEEDPEQCVAGGGGGNRSAWQADVPVLMKGLPLCYMEFLPMFPSILFCHTMALIQRHGSGTFIVSGLVLSC